MGLRDRILKANRDARLAGKLAPQAKKMAAVQSMADKEASKNPGVTWECGHCGAQVLIKDYPQHYFKCEMADKIPKVMPK